MKNIKENYKDYKKYSSIVDMAKDFNASIVTIRKYLIKNEIDYVTYFKNKKERQRLYIFKKQISRLKNLKYIYMHKTSGNYVWLYFVDKKLPEINKIYKVNLLYRNTTKIDELKIVKIKKRIEVQHRKTSRKYINILGKKCLLNGSRISSELEINKFKRFNNDNDFNKIMELLNGVE